MKTVNASQLIYSRVEPAYSSQRKGGFQTVYKTPSLTAADVASIEERVQSFTPLDASQARYQFFQLASGALVITHSCRIESHRAITDAEGRTGAFIAHCLILAQAEFAKLAYNPFALITIFSFVQDPAVMVQTFGQATGVAPSILIPVETPFPAVDSSWAGQEMEKFVALAEAAPNLLQEHQSIQILGEPAEALAALNLLFRLMRQQTRLLCSFDISADNATVKPGDYWAVGRPQRQSRFVYTVNAAQHRVEGEVAQPLPEADLYLGWLKQALATQTLDLVSTKAPMMQDIAEAFTTKTTPLAENLDPTLYAEFAAVHRAYVTQSLQAAFNQFVRPELAVILTRHALDRWPLPNNLQIAAQQKIDERRAGNLILTWIYEAKPQLNDKELAQLQTLAQQVDNAPLLYLAATLRKKPDRKLQTAALARVDSETFAQLLRWLLNPLAPADLVTPAYLHELLSDNRLVQMTNEQMVALVQAMVDVGGVKQLDLLAAYVNQLDQKGLDQIEKSLKQANPTKQFMRAIQSRREQLGPAQSLWTRFLPKPRR